MYLHVTGTVTQPDRLAAFADEERRVLEELKAEGTVVMALRRHDRPGALLVVEADGPGEARERLGRLPYVAHGLLALEYVEVSRL
ncbi:hypothetical protein [Streptomyces sp. NPDC026673]|uniref:hypothetical protein n=1 Tax=Streptomyces sp. NPDC026673 TaxID=3155724 RepID=UPI0033C7AE23